MPVWLRLSIGGAATLMVGMGLGRFSYTPLIPALIEAGELTAAEAGTVGAFIHVRPSAPVGQVSLAGCDLASRTQAPLLGPGASQVSPEYRRR